MQIINDGEQRVCLNSTIEGIIKTYLHSIGKGKLTNLYEMILEQIEPSLLKVAMEQCRYNQTKAARMLGLSRTTFRAKLIKYFGDQYCGNI
jgi:DNA-binding protein Fis